MKFSYICTNYNNSNDTVKAIESLLYNDYSKIKIIVVDNNSESPHIEVLQKLSKENFNVKVIFNKKNVGYFSGLNIGISYLRNHYKDISYAIIGNNDLIFPPEFISSLKSSINKFEEYPVVSPSITTVDGINQNPHVIADISNFRELIYDLYHSNFYAASVITFIAKLLGQVAKRGDEENYEHAQEIWQGHGSCYLLGPLFFSYIKQLWSPTLLFGEEFFLAKQLQDNGFKIYYEPSIKIIHNEHASIGKLARRKHWNFMCDAHKIYRKHNPIIFFTSKTKG